MNKIKKISHNPDILVCIANLSNDEVFTPPLIANMMLDNVEKQWKLDHEGENIWTNPEVKFLDPFAKSGVFLREITRRLVRGLEVKIPNLQERVDHILKNQIYGIAITNLTALLTRRSVYCSKIANGPHSICSAFSNEQGNIWFERLEHDWIGGKRKFRIHPTSGKEEVIYENRRCRYCNAGEKDYSRKQDQETYAYALLHNEDPQDFLTEVFGKKMHFDVIIGNPPYQLSDGGGAGTSAIPIYNKFVEQAKGLEPEYLTMIIPSRWFTGGKGLNDFRRTMLSDKQLRSITDYPDSRHVFDGVDVAGGVCFFLWAKGSNGPCQVTTKVADHEWTVERDLDEFDTFIRDNRAISVVRKVLSKRMLPFSNLVSSRRPFDIDSSDDGDRNGDLYLFNARGDSSIKSGRLGSKGKELIPTWRALVSKTSSEHAGQTDKFGRKQVLSRLAIMPPGSVCTESYLVIGPFDSQKQSSAAISYLKTRFARFLIQSILITQNITSKSFSMLPLVDLNHTWTDQNLYEYFGLDNDEIDFIEKTIREMK